MQNTNRRIRASKISSPQRGFLLVWEFLLLQIWEEVKATKTVSIQRENKLIKICLKIGVAGTTSSAIFCFRLIGGNFGRLNGVSSSSLESLRRDKLDEVDLRYIVNSTLGDLRWTRDWSCDTCNLNYQLTWGRRKENQTGKWFQKLPPGLCSYFFWWVIAKALIAND